MADRIQIYIQKRDNEENPKGTTATIKGIGDFRVPETTPFNVKGKGQWKFLRWEKNR